MKLSVSHSSRRLNAAFALSIFVSGGTVLLLLSGLLCRNVIAASFDCGKARTPVEKTICSYPDISHADEQLASAYAAALRASEKPWRNDVRVKERKRISGV